MNKKSKIDERIDTLFAKSRPKDSAPKPGYLSMLDRITVPVADPQPGQHAPVPVAPPPPSPRRGKVIFILGPLAVCLLTAIFTFIRFNAASSSAPTEQVVPTIPPTQLVQDIQPPTVPSGLTATTNDAKAVNLTWMGSADNTEVSGYTIYRNGASLATVSGSTLTFSDTSAAADTTYSYAVDAFDQGGNHSAVSALLQVTTPGQPGSLVFLLPVMDTYVNAASPTTNYGAISALRVDSSPDVHGYLRFIVAGLAGRSINQARLKIYSNSAAAWGIRVLSVSDNTWNEANTNYNNAPVLGNQLALSPTVETGAWITLDVTPYVTGEGSFNFGIVTESTTAISLASREAGANSPQLILDLH